MNQINKGNMMESVSEVLELVANESSTNKKLELLKTNDSETLKRVFEYAYNPFIKFWIKKIPEYTCEESLTLEQALDKLEKLSSREYTGNRAIEHLSSVLSSVSTANASVISRMVKGDLRIGCSASSANKVWKGLIPDFPYMRCSLPKAAKLEEWPWDKGIYSNLKADGSFVFVNCENPDNIEFVTRGGNAYPMGMFTDLIDEIKSLGITDRQFHGELLVKRDDEILPRQIGNGILNSVAKGGDWLPDDITETPYSPYLQVWDSIPLSEATPKNKYNVPFSKRFEEVESLFSNCKNVEVIENRLVYSLSEAYKHYFEKLDEGMEGTVIKHPDAIWEDTTSKLQVKMKLEVPVDLEIIGFNPGNGKNSDLFGSIKCRTSDGLLEVNVSGFKDKPQKGIMTRKEIWDCHEDLIGSIMTVKSNGVMYSTDDGTHSLFLPVFLEFREDKNVADSMKEVERQFENAIKKLEDAK